MCVGTEATNSLLKQWLERTIQEIDWSFDKKGDKVLEVMAGYGRNYSVLDKKFNHIEMLDGLE